MHDLPNDENKRFVADYRKKYPGLRPSFYGAQSYDAAQLINSAVVAVKGDTSKKDAMKAAMEKANFKSLRGPFKFGNNHIPIQNFYLQDVVKDADGDALAENRRYHRQGRPGSLPRQMLDEVIMAFAQYSGGARALPLFPFCMISSFSTI